MGDDLLGRLILTVVDGFELCRGRVARVGCDLPVEALVVEPVDEGESRELESSLPGLECPMDLSFDAAGGRGFVTAATAWIAYRRGQLDVSNHGVDPSMPFFLR